MSTAGPSSPAERGTDAANARRASSATPTRESSHRRTLNGPDRRLVRRCCGRQDRSAAGDLGTRRRLHISSSTQVLGDRPASKLDRRLVITRPASFRTSRSATPTGAAAGEPLETWWCAVPSLTADDGAAGMARWRVSTGRRRTGGGRQWWQAVPVARARCGEDVGAFGNACARCGCSVPQE